MRRRHREGLEEKLYSFLTSPLERVEGQDHALTALRRETTGTLCIGQSGPNGRSVQVKKIWPPTEFESLTVQPVASCCTDYANQVHR